MLPNPRMTIVLTALAVATGCAFGVPSLVDKGIVTIDIAKTKPAQVSSATVFREDKQTVIRGEAKFPFSVKFGIFSGHIDIDVAVPNGDPIMKRNIRLVRKRIPRQSGRRASFVTRFSIDPPKGTIIHISYHEGKHRNQRS